MRRLTIEEAQSFSGGVSPFFNLQDDGDYAEVIILADTLDDLPIFGVHDVEYDNRTVKVACLRNEGECPLCRAGKKARAIIELPLLVGEELKIFERGITFSNIIASTCRRYKPLAKYIFELERIGKKGDMKTTYNLTKIGEQAINSYKELVKDEDIENLILSIIRNWTVDDMNYYIETGKNPLEDAKNNSFVARTRQNKTDNIVVSPRRLITQSNSSVIEDKDEGEGEGEGKDGTVF